MFEPSNSQNWTLATEENAWVPPSNQNAGWFSCSLENNPHQIAAGMAAASSLVQAGPGPSGPLYSATAMQSVQIYPNYVSVMSGYYDVDLYGWKPVSFPNGNNPEETPIDSSLFAVSSSSTWTNSVMQVQAEQLALQQKTVAIEDQLNSQSLYKTELCRSYEETGTCRYGAKCQFAHGKDELRPVLRHPKYKTEICRTFHNSGTCPYGKRCRFIHLSADEGNLNSINIIPWTRSYEEPQQFALQMNESPTGSFDVDEVASKMRSLELSDKNPRRAKQPNGLKPTRVPGKPVPSNKPRKTPRGTGKQSKVVKKPNHLGHWDDSAAPNPNSSSVKPQAKTDNHRLAFFAHLSGDSVPSQPSSQ
jgi:butyrate response factor 1